MESQLHELTLVVMFYKIINHQVDILCHHILQANPNHTCSSSSSSSSSSSKKSYTYPQEFIHTVDPQLSEQLCSYS